MTWRWKKYRFREKNPHKKPCFTAKKVEPQKFCEFFHKWKSYFSVCMHRKWVNWVSEVSKCWRMCFFFIVDTKIASTNRFARYWWIDCLSYENCCDILLPYILDVKLIYLMRIRWTKRNNVEKYLDLKEKNRKEVE